MSRNKQLFYTKQMENRPPIVRLSVRSSCRQRARTSPCPPGNPIRLIALQRGLVTWPGPPHCVSDRALQAVNVRYSQRR